MTNNVRPITSVEDLADIKMRTMQAPVILTQYREWDANPTAMAFAEVYSGLQAGVVEGQENPIANISAIALLRGAGLHDPDRPRLPRLRRDRAQGHLGPPCRRTSRR